MSGVTIDRKESPPQRLYQLLWRHAALGLWFLRAFVRVVRHSGPDVAQTAHFQEFIGYQREWLGGPVRACGSCPRYPERRARLVLLARRGATSRAEPAAPRQSARRGDRSSS